MGTYDKAWFDAATPDIAKGVRGAIATLVPFYLASRLGRHEFAWMALGGWLGTLVDPGGLRSTRAKTSSAFAVVGGVLLALSECLGPHLFIAACFLFVTAFVASLLRCLGAVWASASTMVTIVVVIGTARGGSQPGRDGAYFAGGAALAVLLSSVIWPIWTHLPLRRAQSNIFEALARYGEEIAHSIQSQVPEGDPLWVELARRHHRALRNAIEEARRLALGGRARRAGETRIGSNLRVLLGLAEAQFPLLVTLKEMSELGLPESRRVELLQRLAGVSHRNQEIAGILRTPNLRTHETSLTIPPSGAAPSAGSSARALLVHLEDASRTAKEVACSLGARMDAAPDRTSPQRSRWRETLPLWRADLGTLRDACSPRSGFFQHGLRVASSVSIASLIAHGVSLHPHWVTVTTLAVLQPYSGATRARAAERVIGTVLGSIAAALINLTVRSPLLLAALMFPLSVAAVATQRRSYRLFTFFLTPVFVLLAERYVGDWWTAAARAGDAALGGGIAFVAAVLVFPSRERNRLPELLARMLEAIATYALTVFEPSLRGTAAATNTQVMSARRAAGIALSEAENSLERLLVEPRHADADGEYALQLITYGRRTASALTAIDTYFTRDLTPTEALDAISARRVADYVTFTLKRAAAFARGATPTAQAELPELPNVPDLNLRTTLARLLRGAALVADISRSGHEQQRAADARLSGA